MSCPDCFKGAIHDHGTPTGKMETLYNQSCYVATPSNPSPSGSAIFFICDAFGLNLVNNKLLADSYAAETGFKVIAPDIIPGGGVSTSLLSIMPVATGSVAYTDIWGQLSRAWAMLNMISVFLPFMIRAGPAKGLPLSLEFARALKASLPPGAKLGVAGFCWGGYSSTNLCKETMPDGSRLIDAQFCGHPSGLTAPEMVVDAIATGTPYSMAIGDVDFVMNEKTVLATEAALREKVGEPGAGGDHPYEIRIYKGCGHGFAARAQPDNQVEKDAAEEARVQAIEWYKKYLS